jgi:hypothetical protein
MIALYIAEGKRIWLSYGDFAKDQDVFSLMKFNLGMRMPLHSVISGGARTSFWWCIDM